MRKLRLRQSTSVAEEMNVMGRIWSLDTNRIDRVQILVLIHWSPREIYIPVLNLSLLTCKMEVIFTL